MGGIAGGVLVFPNKRVVVDVFEAIVEEGGAKPVTTEVATKAARIKDRIIIIIIVKGKQNECSFVMCVFFGVCKIQKFFP
jgi:hypothetical protein